LPGPTLAAQPSSLLAGEEKNLSGNCNRDESLDITDVLFILDILFIEDEYAYCHEQCDFDGNGDLNISDAISLIKYLFQRTTPIESHLLPEDACETTSQKPAIINSLPDGPVTLIQGEPISFSVEAIGMVGNEDLAYTWSVDGLAREESGPRFRLNTTELTPGTHLIQVVVVDDSGGKNNRSTHTWRLNVESSGTVLISIIPGIKSISISTGDYRWEISTTEFNVLQSAHLGTELRISGGLTSVDFLGSTSKFGPPDELKMGDDWIELRGWADASKNLWYIARYQFFGGQPFCRLVLTLVDRQESTVTYNSLDSYWLDRFISNWRLEIYSTGGSPTVVTQHNSFSYSCDGEPWIDPSGVSGTSWEWAKRVTLDPNRFQIQHATGSEENQVRWYPMFDGEANVTALYTAFPKSLSYRNAEGVTYEVVDANKEITRLIVDQGCSKQELDLGTYMLNTSSAVRLKATGTSGLVIAGPLRITPTNGDPAFEISIGKRHPGYISKGPVTVAVKDFWQHHPISLFRTQHAMGWTAIKKPEVLMGGMGITLETMFSLEGSTDDCLEALYRPPTRTLPHWVDPLDGSLALGSIGKRYNTLLEVFTSRYRADLESMDNFGWKNWGDYQIDFSYTTTQHRVQDWANLQYDLPTGLLMAWLRTGNPELWRYAQASIRHLMDIDTVKFHPFHPKYNGGGYRKGDMKISTSHFGAEVVIPFTFAFRSLLIYYELTGEEWARDIAKQSIDNLAYIEVDSPNWSAGAGDRDACWVLRALIAGALHFPDDPTYDYKELADNLVDKLIAHYRKNGKLPGNQPVWQGQMVEALSMYHQYTGRAEVADVIIGHVDYLLRQALIEKDGVYEFLYCQGDDIYGSCTTANWSGEYNYALLWLGSIAYAYHLTGDPFYWNWANRLFSYCEERLLNEHHTRPWTSLLSFPFFFIETSGNL